jgi:hypothetical protein
MGAIVIWTSLMKVWNQPNAMSADSVPSLKTNICQNKLIYCAILELIRGAQCLIEVIRFSGEEM